MIKAFIFDLDGVVTDTSIYHFMAWKEIAKELQIEFSEKQNEKLKGVSRKRSFEIILEEGGIAMGKEKKEYYCQKKNKIYLSYINKLNENNILPGVKEFLEEARKKGYKTALGSASKNAVLILERLGLKNRFDVVVDGTKVLKAKPDPEVFISGANALGIPYESCLVFEDSEAGIEAARKCGMKAVGVGNENVAAKGDYYIEGFSGAETNLLKQLESYF